MALIKSISGIRGTIGGKPGESLSPLDIVRFTAAFGTWLTRRGSDRRIVVGRDGRISGPMVSELVIQTLISLGLDVIDLGLSTTPTVEMAVTANTAAGGIIVTASHNPAEWNALKLLNAAGEFISAADGAEVLALAQDPSLVFANVQDLGTRHPDGQSMQHHLTAVCSHSLVRPEAIRSSKFRVVVDAINSSGAIFVPELLKALGVAEDDIILLNGEVNGQFAHNPEPLPEHLQQLADAVVQSGADLGIAVDPDVDRLVIVAEDGSMFGEEYTLVAVADYVLQHRKGNTVSNLSSSRALKDVTERHGGRYYASAVGEVNVVRKMREVDAVIGGEGNGGIIDPELHYGRDALVGIALLLSHIALSGLKVSALRKIYPDYHIVKHKLELPAGIDMGQVFEKIGRLYTEMPQHTEDGLRIEFHEGWVHLRSSNTEPIIRVIAESTSEASAKDLVIKLSADIESAIHG